MPRSLALLRPLSTTVVGALALGLLSLTGPAAPPAAPATDLVPVSSNPVTPGNFTGRAFDQCETVSESAMKAWRAHSPYRAVGVYLSGDSRACKTQRNLTATWVRNQLADGWRIMPITLGPQASCSTRFPRYGSRVDPTINPSSANTYAAARQQGRAEADTAVARAKALGIVPGSTLFYDLEAWNLKHSTACNTSALWFTHAWTVRLHEVGYASGFYSSAASGIKLLDDERVRAGSPYRLPDQIWIADWDGKRNTASTYIRSDGWQNGGRAKQYLGDHNETWGGVRINIDSNWLELRTPRLPGAGAPAPAPTPTPTPAPAPSGPRFTGSDMSDPRCSPATISLPTYRRTGPARTGGLVALQCLLKQRSHYPYEVTGRWNAQTTTALRAFQGQVGRPQKSFASRADWVALHAHGTGRTTLRAGSSGTDVIRLQRALNAATNARLAVSGRVAARTTTALARYQRKVKVKVTRTADAATWTALQRGRW